jgi:chromosome segregation ATPase
MARLSLLYAIGCITYTAVAVSTLALEQQAPTTRVVELLENLAEQAEKDGKAEEKLYEKFVCWATTIIDGKTTSNEDAAKKVQELEAWIGDLKAGVVELTSEGSDLTKEISDLSSAIEEATAMRDKEHADFLAGEDEMSKAISALDQAMEVLKDATADHTEGVFMEQRHASSTAAATESFAQQAARSANLAHAADLATNFLSRGDAFFLRRLLTGSTGLTGKQAPTPDWKKTKQ